VNRRARSKAGRPAAVSLDDSGPIPIDRDGLVETLGDFMHSSAWESLRLFGAPASAAELASALGRPVAAAQRSLDALEKLGIVRRLAATARARRIRYEVTTQKVVIHLDPANQRHRAIHGQLGHAFERRSAAHINDALPYHEREATRGYIDRRLLWGHFEPEDLEQIKAIVGMLDLLMARVNGRHAHGAAKEHSKDQPKSDPRAKAAKSANSDGFHAQPCNYHVSFAIVPIASEFPPPALIQVDDRQNMPYAKRHRAVVAFASLTAREREVFDLLMTGRSLAEIGRDLGIARPTVATLAQHCYAKFGVGGRQELVASALGAR